MTVVEEQCFVSNFSAPQRSSDGLGASPIVDKPSPDDVAAQIDASKEILPAALTDEESAAVQLLTAFMHANLMEHMPSLSSPNQELSTSRMHIDSHTVKALEIREGLREGGTTGSLLHVVKRTVTSSGTRPLARWICKEARYTNVGCLTHWQI